MFNISLPQYHQVLDHFFAEVVVDAVNFFLGEQCRKMSWQFGGWLQVMAKWLLNYEPCPKITNIDNTSSNKWSNV